MDQISSSYGGNKFRWLRWRQFKRGIQAWLLMTPGKDVKQAEERPHEYGPRKLSRVTMHKWLKTESRSPPASFTAKGRCVSEKEAFWSLLRGAAPLGALPLTSWGPYACWRQEDLHDHRLEWYLPWELHGWASPQDQAAGRGPSTTSPLSRRAHQQWAFLLRDTVEAEMADWLLRMRRLPFFWSMSFLFQSVF